MMLSETLPLTQRLARVLNALEGAYGNILSHKQIGQVLHPNQERIGDDNNVKVAIFYLRRKLQRAGTHDIETIWGRGYRLVEKAE
jgi:DNA-binding winged helix-turn-helix (wHTH) protein